MTPKDPAPYDVRTELARIQLAARYASQPDELKEAVESLALAVMALMDSFGLQTIVVKPAIVQPAGAADQQSVYIFEQHAHDGKVTATRTVQTVKLAMS